MFGMYKEQILKLLPHVWSTQLIREEITEDKW